MMNNEFTGCPNGRYEDSRPHDFDDFEPTLGGKPLMYCRRCGEVRRLEVPLEEGRATSTTFTVGGSVDPSKLSTLNEGTGRP